jgi:hypothetical protein
VLNDNIKQSSIIVAQQLNAFLVGEPEVNINGRNHSLGQALDEQFLRKSRTLFIGSGEDNTKGGNC